MKDTGGRSCFQSSGQANRPNAGTRPIPIGPSETGRPAGLELVRGLSFTSTTALVIGSVIGTGVFLKAAVMTQLLGRGSTVLWAWVIAGILTFAGVLVYAELGTLFPDAGGEYVYLRASYGDSIAFCYGWMRFLVASSGTIASLAVGFAIFCSALVGNGTVWLQLSFRLFGQNIAWRFGTQQIIAIAVVLVVSALNAIGVAFGGRIQALLTALKALGIIAIVVGVFGFSPVASWSHLATSAPAASHATWSTFGTAMLAALWAYNGWNQMPMVAGEVRDPVRNFPRALIIGMGVVIVLYLLANFAYFAELPAAEVAMSSSTRYPDALPVATKAAQAFAGPLGIKLVSIIFLVSTLGALHGAILTCARVPFAMARDGLFFLRVGELNSRTRVPVASILLQAAWSSVLAVSGTFDQLTDYVIFASWIFYGLAVFSVFVLRRKMPYAARPYRTIGYPVVPAVFVLFATWLVFNTLKTRPIESLAGVVLTLSGLPVYWHLRRKVGHHPRQQ
jgi:APA family basic amino acid/polyamine antiporter